MAYVIGVSSGIFSAAPQQEKMQYVTLSQKAQYVLTQGVKFNQIDVETISEFKGPNIKKEIEQVKKLGIAFGFHGESGAVALGDRVPDRGRVRLGADGVHRSDEAAAASPVVWRLPGGGRRGRAGR